MKNITSKLILALGVAALAFLALVVPAHAQACCAVEVPYGYNADYVNVVYTGPIQVPPPIVQGPTYYSGGGSTVYVNPPSYPQVVQQPVYQPVIQPVIQPVYTPVYPPLGASCSANTTYSQVGQTVTWSASASGSNGLYNYTWGGSDNVGGYGQYLNATYNYPGLKQAYVTVNSNGQTITVSCANSVNVAAPVIVQPVPVPVPIQVPVKVITPVTVTPVITQPKLDVGCYADPTSGNINQPVTWNAEVTGGVAPYKYSWSGTDNLSGITDSVTRWYSTYGTKYAIVTVVSADGRTATRACSNSVYIKKPASTATYVKPKATPTPTPICNCGNTSSSGSVGSVGSNVGIVQNNPYATPTPAPVMQLESSANQAANSFLAIANVPWGWVSLLVILVLFATVLYLLFNRQKI